MTTSRISTVAIALSIAFGFVGGAGSTQPSSKDQNLSGTVASSKRMADGREWTTANLNVNTPSSCCYAAADYAAGSLCARAQTARDAAHKRGVTTSSGSST